MSLWLFGLFTTLVLVGVWGRAVTADRPTLTDSAQLLLASDVVNDRLEAWLTDGLAVSSSVAPARIADVVAMVAESNEADAAIAIAADEAVTSALSPPGTARALDLRPAALELAPAVSRALAEAGIDVAPGAVSAAMDNADLSLSSAPGSWVSGAAHRGTAALTRVLVVGMVGMIGTGAMSVWASDDRVLRIRTLASRVALSSVTFAIMLRLGSWAVDPSGGRSSVAGAASIAIGSNGHVPMLVAVVAVGVALLARWWRHHGMASGDRDGQPVSDSYMSDHGGRRNPSERTSSAH